MTTVRRYHTFKDTSSNNLLIADSQAKDLQFAEFNILSIPGTRIGKVTANFYPRKNQYKTIVLFVGGNDAYDRRTPSTLPALDIAKELALLVDSLCDLASSVFVLGIPHRGDTRTSTVNAESLLSQVAGSIGEFLKKSTARTIWVTTVTTRVPKVAEAFNQY